MAGGRLCRKSCRAAVTSATCATRQNARHWHCSPKEAAMKDIRRFVREIAFVAALALVMFAPGALVLAQGPLQGMPDLVAMLKATPGCLGVDAPRTMSGKQVIFAWFENKKAVLNWYYSEGHQRLIKTLASGGNPGRTPLADLADASGPILAITPHERAPTLPVASVTLGDKPQVGVQLPVSQIAIELYAPLPGGLAAGGRFAPSSVKVKGLVEVPIAPR